MTLCSPQLWHDAKTLVFSHDTTRRGRVQVYLSPEQAFSHRQRRFLRSSHPWGQALMVCRTVVGPEPDFVSRVSQSLREAVGKHGRPTDAWARNVSLSVVLLLLPIGRNKRLKTDVSCGCFPLPVEDWFPGHPYRDLLLFPKRGPIPRPCLAHQSHHII